VYAVSDMPAIHYWPVMYRRHIGKGIRTGNTAPFSIQA